MITQTFRLKKLVKLICQIWFYSLAVLLFAFYKQLDVVNFPNIIQSVLPLGQTNWFAYTYILLYVFIPFFNPCLQNLNKQYYQGGLTLATVLWFVIPTFFNIWPKMPYLDMGGTPLLLFLYLYALGAYIRLYGDTLILKVAHRLIGFGLAGMVCGILLVDFLSISHHSFMQRNFYFIGEEYNLFALCIGVGFFIYFLRTNIQYHRWINGLASTTFGIYLIHDSNLFRTYLWRHVFSNADFYHSVWLPVHAISAVLLVFFCGALIDWIRTQLFEKTMMKKLGPVCEQWQVRWNQVWCYYTK